MTVSNQLFTDLATRSFSRVQAKVSDLQAQISSGKNDPRASADQMRASQLSALKEERAALDHFTNAADQAASRVSLSDQAIGDAAVIMRRLTELAIQAGNSTLPAEGIQGIRAEAQTLRTSLVEIANRTDALGQPLFAGYSAAPAFKETDDGVQYVGDGGRPSQRLSETLTMAVGLNGDELFMTAPLAGDRTSVFGIVDKLVDSMDTTMYEADDAIAVTGRGKLVLDADRTTKTLSMTINGPEGSVDIEAELVAGLPQPMVDVINAHSATTGVTAEVSEDGKDIILNAESDFELANFKRSDNPQRTIGSFQQLEFRGQPGKNPIMLKAVTMSSDAMLLQVQAAVGHFAAKRAEVGAMGATVDAQKEALDFRQLRIDEAVAGLEDLDIAKAVTELQTLLLTRDASQQTYVKITQTSLFDFLR